MVRPYVNGDPASIADLKAYFPDVRPQPPARCFEFSVAVAGGISTGAYIAGVFDFLIEALDAYSEAQAANPAGAPTHKVRLANLTGTSAGGLSASLAATCLLKDAPHVYDDAKWAKLIGAGLVSGAQQPDLNPLYAAWVQQVDLTNLLAAPTPAETELAVFAPAPAEIGKAVLGKLATQPNRTWPPWAAEPLDLRVLVGNLRGVPYTLTFGNQPNPRAGERLTLHRDQVAFAVSPTGLPGAPDAYQLTNDINVGPSWSIFQSAAVASSAIPGVFAPVPVNGVDPVVYQWRDCYFDTTLQLPILDQPFWEQPPATYSFTATDGGVFDNEPFDVAHRMMSGATAVNRRDGAGANRAVILLAAVVDDQAGDPQDPILPPTPPPASGLPQTTPLSRLLSAAWSIFNAPIEQSRWDAFDLALVKSESIFSRFMISPAREDPNPATPTLMMGPSKSLMSLPLHEGLGFAAQAYRRHDFLLGRRNAQKFLSEHFMLPAGNPIINTADGWEPTDLRTAPDPNTGAPTVFYPIIPLRGTAHQRFEEPLPAWDWQALTDDQISLLTNLFGGRVDNAWSKIKDSLLNPPPGSSFWAGLGAGVRNVLIAPLVWGAWTLWLRPAVVNAFKDLLTKAKAQLNPANL